MIVLDLDGTLLEGGGRHYACYSRILVEAGFAPAPFAEYWALKRRHAPLAEVLAMSGACSVAADFTRRWSETIELAEYLALDVVQPGAEAVLRSWKAHGQELVLVTSRCEGVLLREQLGKLGILDVFDAVLAATQPETGQAKGARFLRHVRGRAPSGALWVGDTEADVIAARYAGLSAVAVACGLRDRPFLLGLCPDHLYDDLPDMACRHHLNVFPSAGV